MRKWQFITSGVRGAGMHLKKISGILLAFEGKMQCLTEAG